MQGTCRGNERKYLAGHRREKEGKRGQATFWARPNQLPTEKGTGTSAALPSQSPFPLDLDRPGDWLERVNRPQTDDELAALRRCLSRGRPFGTDAWVRRTAKKLGLESALRPRGRPRKRKTK